MSWILDIEDDLVNLDICETVECCPLQARDGEDEKFAVIAVRDRTSIHGSHTLLESSEDECQKLMQLISTKLPMVKR